MMKKTFVIISMLFFVLGVVSAEKGDVRIGLSEGYVGYSRIAADIEYSITDQLSFGSYIAWNSVDLYYSLPFEDFTTSSSKISPVIFGIIGGYDFLKNKTHELFLGGLISYGYSSNSATGITVTVNSEIYAQRDYLVSLSSSLIVRYSYTFNFGLFLGIADSLNIVYDVYDPDADLVLTTDQANRLPLFIVNTISPFIGYKLNL